MVNYTQTGNADEKAFVIFPAENLTCVLGRVHLIGVFVCELALI